MYAVSVILLMVVLPLISIGKEHYIDHASTPMVLLAGKWFVFWSAGIRSATAGLRQLLQPRFTVEEIFGIRSDEALPFVRELGIANFGLGGVGILSIVRADFVLPAAIAACLFYGIAGVRHATDRQKGVKQNLAMVTDVFVSVVLITYIVYAVEH
jgi:hypothetical protein